jgi:hypothetical protein
MQTDSQIWRFRITPSKRSKHFFHVTVFPTRREMLDYNKAICRSHPFLSHGKGPFLAKTYCTGTGSRFTLGEIILNRERLEFEYLAHEATHAALWWLFQVRDLSLDNPGKGEEELAGAVGRLTQCMWVRLQRKAHPQKRRRR